MIKQPKEHQIVLLHGWASNPSRWDEVIKNIHSGKIYVPFIPGFDPKKPLIKPYSIDDYGEWLRNYIISNKIKSPILIGHSNGGRIIAHYTAKYDNVSKLIFIGSAGIKNAQPLFLFKKAIFKKVSSIGKRAFQRTFQNTLVEKILYKLAGESDYRMASPIMKQTMQNMLEYDIEKDLAHIQNPVLCIWGQFDKSTPLWMGKKIHSLLPGSKMTVIDRGHNLHREVPEKLATIIDSFVLS